MSGYGIHDQGDGTAVVTFDGRVAFVVTRETVPTEPRATWFYAAGVAVGDPGVLGKHRRTVIHGGSTLVVPGEPTVESAARTWAEEMGR